MNKTPEQLRVKILEDGIWAKEQNPLGETAPRYVPLIGGMEALVVESDRSMYFRERLRKWREAESKLRIFEIEPTPGQRHVALIIESPYFLPNTIHTAELLPNGKIKIID